MKQKGWVFIESMAFTAQPNSHTRLCSFLLIIEMNFTMPIKSCDLLFIACLSIGCKSSSASVCVCIWGFVYMCVVYISWVAGKNTFLHEHNLPDRCGYTQSLEKLFSLNLSKGIEVWHWLIRYLMFWYNLGRIRWAAYIFWKYLLNG